VTFAGRILGVLHAPRLTFTHVAANPRWLGVMLATLGVTAGCAAALMNTEVGRQAFVDQWVRSAEAFGRDVSDEQYARLEELSRMGSIVAAASAVVSGPAVAIGSAGVLLVVFNGGMGGSATYTQVLAIVTHAGVILALRQVFATPLNYLHESLASPTSLGVFFQILDEASPAAHFLGIIDLFVIWWAVTLAIGMGVLYRRRTPPIVLAFLATYVAVALVLAAAMAVSGGTA
jgi:Yip1 domain